RGRQCRLDRCTEGGQPPATAPAAAGPGSGLRLVLRAVRLLTGGLLTGGLLPSGLLTGGLLTGRHLGRRLLGGRLLAGRRGRRRRLGGGLRRRLLARLAARRGAHGAGEGGLVEARRAERGEPLTRLLDVLGEGAAEEEQQPGLLRQQVPAGD